MIKMKTYKLLLVTDDRSFFADFLDKQKTKIHQITRADTDDKAITLLDQTVFDVIVVDCSGTIINLRRILPKAKAMPYKPLVMILTDHDSVHTIHSSLGQLADDFVFKRFAWEEIFIRISMCLQKKKTEMTINKAIHLSENPKDEKNRLKAQQMDSLSVLAGGIAHQFNNALSIITGNTELIEMIFPGDNNLAKYIEPIKDSAKRMANLTTQLNAYAGEGKYYLKDILVSDFVQDTLELIGYTLNPNIDLVTHFEADKALIAADPAQMQMVISSVMAQFQ
jgi:DNA-binding response OmpR family regulator